MLTTAQTTTLLAVLRAAIKQPLGWREMGGFLSFREGLITVFTVPASLGYAPPARLMSQLRVVGGESKILVNDAPMGMLNDYMDHGITDIQRALNEIVRDPGAHEVSVALALAANKLGVDDV